MPNISKIITMTSVGSNSGPNYSLWYSVNCIDYTLISSSVSLPNIGSTIEVSIPDTSTCVKLINLSPVCDNEIVVYFGSGTTTTTSTTLAPTTTTTIAPTTTTSTTLAPTTTTTTQAPIYYNMDRCDGTGQYTYPFRDNTGTFGIGSIAKIGSAENICVTLTSVYVGTPFIYFTSNDGIDYATCFDCNGITTTTTSTTSTTTLAPTTTTTTIQGGYYRAKSCADNVTKLNSVMYPAGTFNSGDRITALGQNWVIEAFVTNDPGGNLYIFTATGQTGCPATTTTTTTLPPALVVTNGSVTCSGTAGGWRSSFTGGSGTYTNVAYANSQANAADWLDGSGSGTGAMVILTPGDTFYDWSGIANGTWYVALKDSLGNITVQNTAVVVNCVTTTTTQAPTTTTTIAPTTTTTTQAPKFRYLLYNVDTNTCLTTGGPTPVWSYLSITSGFYKLDSDPTLYYLQTSSHTDDTIQFVNAIVAECIPPTTTTTTQAPPPTTTTTTQAPAQTATLGWSYLESNGANGTIDIYVNGSIVESRSITSTGTWTGLNVGDVIYCEINTTGCSGANDYANSYCTGIITDASCDLGVSFLTSTTYTVQSGDIGNTITLAMYSTCDVACV